jgi:hypothetical protein
MIVMMGWWWWFTHLCTVNELVCKLHITRMMILILWYCFFQRFNRYPLIIDPSGQATEFILNEFRDKKITKTSFLDDSFRKNLESALRFGNPLLVQVKRHLYIIVRNCVFGVGLRNSSVRQIWWFCDAGVWIVLWLPCTAIELSARDVFAEKIPQYFIRWPLKDHRFRSSETLFCPLNIDEVSYWQKCCTY